MDLSRASISSDWLSDLVGSMDRCGLRRTSLAAGGRWGLRFERRTRLKFATVVSGRGWIGLPGRPARLIRRGDALLIGDTAFSLASDPDATLGNGTALYLTDNRAGVCLGSSDGIVMLGGTLESTAATTSALMAALPDFAFLGGDNAMASTVAATLACLESDAEQEEPGTLLVSQRLADILVVQALRLAQSRQPLDTSGWVAALADRQIGTALRLMHGEPGRRWAVAELAAAVGMSRSAFALRFRQKVGRSPQDYLRWTRMTIARDALQQERSTVAAVAERLGYASESAFSHAYKRLFGHTPRRPTTNHHQDRVEPT